MKQFAHALLSTLFVTYALMSTPNQALAQGATDYPNKPVRIIVVFAAGGGLDIVGRLVADRLTRSVGQSVLVENRPGAGGNIASAYVARSAPDGYTLLLTTNNYNINSFIYNNPGYDSRKDFVPVIELTEAPSILITGAQSPYRSLEEVVTAARSQPGKLVYGSAGSGSPTHIAGELLKKAIKIDLTHIPYKGGGPANQDVLGGQIPFAMAALPPAMPHVQAGKLRALVVTSEKRWPTLPEVPTVAESGHPGFTHMTWIGIVAPSGTPPAIIARLNREIAVVLSNPDVRERIKGLGAEPVGKSASDFAAMLKAEYEATGELVSQLGLKVD